MVCAFIVSHREIGAAKVLAEWIAELGGVKEHECLLCLTKPASRLDADLQLKPILERAFSGVTTFIPRDEVETPWPNDKVDARSPNHMFCRVSQEMEWNIKKPWLWMEMDAVPLKSSWMNELDREYEKGKQPFMGVKLDAGGRPYMSGIAVYPANITRCTPMLRNPGLNQLGGQVPFDVFAGLDTTRLMHPTNLIQYVKPNPGGLADWSVFHESLEPQAVLYHRSKGLELIEFLRGDKPHPEPAVFSGTRVNGKMEIQPFETSFREPMTFEQLTRYHTCALEGLASTAERRKKIVGLLQIAGLVPENPKRMIPVNDFSGDPDTEVITHRYKEDSSDTLCGIHVRNGMGLSVSYENQLTTCPECRAIQRRRGRPAKKKRTMSPAARAKCAANLAKAREAKKAKQLVAA